MTPFKTIVSDAMKTVLRHAVRDDIRDALDHTEQALRTVEAHRGPQDLDIDAVSLAEVETLVDQAYQRLCIARQIMEKDDA